MTKRLFLVIAFVFLAGCAKTQFEAPDAQSGVSDKTTGDRLTAAEFTAVKNTADTADALATVNESAISTLEGYWTTLDAISGILKINGAGSYSAAVAGTDYLAPGALPDGTTATTQIASNQTTHLATNEFVHSMASRDGVNVLVDPDFTLQADGVESWYTPSGATYTAPAYGAYGPNSRDAVKMTHSATVQCAAWTYKRVPVKQGDVFWINFSYYLDATYDDDLDAGAQVELIVFNAAGSALEYLNVYTGETTKGSWATKSGFVTVTEATAQYAVPAVLVQDSGASGTGYASVDYIEIRRATNLPVNDSNFKGAGTVANIPSSPLSGDIYTVLHDGASPCDTSSGGGSYSYNLIYNGADWDCIGDGAGGVVQLDGLSDVDDTNAGTARRPLVSDGDGTYSFLINDMQRLETVNGEPSGEAVGDVIRAGGYTAGWDPLDLHTLLTYDGDYFVICTAAGSPGTYRGLYYITGSEVYMLEDTSIPPITDADGIVLTAVQMNHAIVMTGAGDVDIPADQCDTATGKWLTVISNGAFLNSITSNDASDQFVLPDGTVLTAGNELDCGDGSDDAQCTVYCYQTNKWKVTGAMNATPADGGVAD